MHPLSYLGFDPFFEDQLTDETEIPARIAAERRGDYQVWSERGVGYALLAGRLIREMKAEGYPGVGDWVSLRSHPDPEIPTVIERTLNRRTVFIRGAAGREARGQVVAANVDQVFVVCGLDDDYNLRRIERYLARVFASGAQPIVILNKADLVDDPLIAVGEVEACCANISIYVTSALHSEGLSEIRSLIQPGQTVAVVGSSGTGKSTLVNALLGEERMATGAVRQSDGRGVHTTTHRQLSLLPDGGLLLDTPGMREMKLLDHDGIDKVFSDIGELSAQCKFRNCSHESEPGCAVKQAIDEGRMPNQRLEHYMKLDKEAQSFELRQSEQQRRKSEKVLAQTYRQGDLVRRLKRGE